MASEHSLIGGGPQGTLLGMIEYLVQSNDSADCVKDDDRYKFIDDLTILEIISLSGVLIEFDCNHTVPSDIGVDLLYLPPSSFETQDILNNIAAWTEENKMRINVKKSNYMIFTRTKTDFVTRLSINNSKLEEFQEVQIVGVWLASNLKWNKNTKELARKAYSRMSMLTKLKYVGVSLEDLIEIYVLFIRSIVEYCAVVWHSSLTVELVNTLERVQKICLKVILGESYVSYSAALEMCNLKTLYERREERCLSFALECLKHPLHRRLFPLNYSNKDNKHCSRENFLVNFGRTTAYKDSAIPYLQRRLNMNNQ